MRAGWTSSTPATASALPSQSAAAWAATSQAGAYPSAASSHASARAAAESPAASAARQRRSRTYTFQYNSKDPSRLLFLVTCVFRWQILLQGHTLQYQFLMDKVQLD